MKLLVVVQLMFAFLLVSANDHQYQQNNFSWGSRGPQDVLLLRENVEAEAKWLRVSKVDLHYPQPFQFGNQITAIDVYDNEGYADGDGEEGAYGKIKSGGIGRHHVSLRFKSQRGRGMNFTVEIYGRK